jgi:catechol 2,3-dioxygenase-like lactoylglutathione lyase family enzyme
LASPQPITASPTERHGEGPHHITFKTDDIEAAIEQVLASGYELVDVNLADDRWKEAFLRPSTAHGTLIQLAQSTVAEEHTHPSNLGEIWPEPGGG